MKPSDRNKTWRQRHPEQSREIGRRYRERNREKFNARARELQKTEAYKQTRRAWRQRNREHIREVARAYKYGLKPGEFEKLFEQQGRVCAICKHDKPRGLNWHVDHDHETGRFRGILCKGCNTALGAFGDTIGGLMRAVRYLTDRADDVLTRDKAA